MSIPGGVGTERGTSIELLGHIGRYLPSSVVPAFLGLLFTAVFTRTFTAAQFGRFSLAMSAATLLASLAGQWLQQGITRFLPAAQSPEAAEELRGAVALGLAWVSAIILAVGAVACAWAWWQTRPAWGALSMAGVAAALVLAHLAILAAMLQASMRAGRYTVYRLAEAAARFGLSLLLVFALWRDETSLVLAQVFSVGLLLPLLRRDAGAPSYRVLAAQWRRYQPGLRRLASYGLPMVGWYLAAMLLDMGDRYIIQFFRGSQEVGIYSASYGLVYGAAGLLTAPILLAAHPFLMRAWGQGGGPEASRWLGTIAEWFAIMGMVLTAGLWVLARDVGRFLLGAEFRQGFVIMPIILGGLVAWQLGMYTHKPLEFREKTRLMLAAGLCAAGANIALNVLLVPRFGYLAAAWTTLACYVLYAATTYWLGRRELPWRLDVWRLARFAAVTIAVTAVAAIAAPVLERWAGYAAGLVFKVGLVGAFAAFSTWRLLLGAQGMGGASR